MSAISIHIDEIPSGVEGRVLHVIHFVGTLDESNVDQESQKIYELLQKYPNNHYLVMDLAGLEYMNSKSIGYLTDWYGKTSVSGGKILLAAPRENILDILNVVGLTQLMNAYESLEEALAEAKKA